MKACHSAPHFAKPALPLVGGIFVPVATFDAALAAVERLLAAQGDAPDSELVRLQHTLSELRIP